MKYSFDAFMKNKGFFKKGTTYFRVENDVAFLVLFEKPSALTYCSFAFMPLYMPAKSVYLSYGNRMNNCFPQFTPLTTSADAEVWYPALADLLQAEVFPFWEKISSAEKICAVFGSRMSKKYARFVSCPPDKIAKLRIYSRLRCTGKADAEEVSAYKKQILAADYLTDRMKYAELEEIEKLQAAPTDYLDGVIDESIKLFG